MAVKQINLDSLQNQITAFIGPSGCGKSTLLQAYNRLNDFILGARVEGAINYKAEKSCSRKLRTRVFWLPYTLVVVGFALIEVAHQQILLLHLYQYSPFGSINACLFVRSSEG